MTDDELQKELLPLVPADGSISNPRLRKALSGVVGRTVTERRYKAARDALVARGELLLGAGRGGTVRRAASPTSSKARSSRFSASYYGDTSRTPAWRPRSKDFVNRLRPLLQSSGNPIEERIRTAATAARKALHPLLRTAMQLGDVGREGARAGFYVVNDVPPPVLALLADIPDALLWALFHGPEAERTQRSLERFRGDLEILNGPRGFGNLGIRDEDFARAEDALRRLNDNARQRSADTISALLRLDVDCLGAYFFQSDRRRIELYWIVVWLTANQLGVQPEDLTTAVVCHELAHLYHHIGVDADGQVWGTDAFGEADDFIVEGLAQFYTDTVLKSRHPPAHEAFRKLLPEQAAPYQDWQRWLPSAPRRQMEIVRSTLLDTRADGIVRYSDFRDCLQKHASRLG